MQYVFNQLSIPVLLSVVAVCGIAMANSATASALSADSLSESEGSDRHSVVQEPSAVVDTQGAGVRFSSLPSSIDRHNLSMYGPWWIENEVSSNTRQLIKAIETASTHGLNPEAYGLSGIMQTIDALEILNNHISDNSTQSENGLSPDIKLLRTALIRQYNKAFTKLAKHLGDGVINASAVQKDYFRESTATNTQMLLYALTTGTHTVSSALESVIPAHPEYLRLTRKMRDLLAEQASGTPRTIVELSDNLSESQQQVNATNLQTRLIQSGDLALDAYTSIDTATLLQTALSSFQSRHGIPPSGEADQQTLEALNVSITDEIEAVALSLERWRWMPHDLGSKHVLVNIPEYRAVVRSESNTLLSMDVIVGSVEYPTPVFSRDMSYIDVNPKWTVPQSIANRQLIPREREQPGYLASRNFDILKREGKKFVKIPHEQVSAADLAKKRFPYTLQQRGGSGNALGKVKFMMPNRHQIYLHDTPSTELFSRDDRALSNGCIRLSKPEQMANLLLLADGFSEQEVSAAWSSTRIKRFTLRTPVPTHMTYLTTWVDENDLLHRRADIYGYNDALADALRASNTLLSTIRPALASTEINASLAEPLRQY